ncbi:hypothetical protein PoB_000069400 [Plakobranchus ocellatus]|uniref:Uncharacterized protein n=1 Tax=Plakobranchus ocellatus TaxID=259542 RepID=A0AAV3XSY2_9GAST|nr:hypothetical protein PoB_000069400 [Plakobranchus ocellatus]
MAVFIPNSSSLSWLLLARLGLLLMLVISAPKVTSFSVGGVATRLNGEDKTSDITKTLTLLQRERRRVNDGYPDAKGFLEGRPLSAIDIGNWLRDVHDNKMLLDDHLSPYLDLQEEPAWMSDGTFRDFAADSLRIKPTKEEIEDIFSDEEALKIGHKSEKAEDVAALRKKKRESSKNPAYSSYSIPIGAHTSLKDKPLPSEDNLNLPLDPLTQEEFSALMKAVGKLKNRIKFNSGNAAAERKITVAHAVKPEQNQEMAIVQPASKEELQSLFAREDNDIGKESEKANSEATPDSKVVIEEEIESPGGRGKVMEVYTSKGGTRVTELETPDGHKHMLEENLPKISGEAALRNHEKELSDALVSRLEENSSDEAAEDSEMEENDQAAKVSQENPGRQQHENEIMVAAEEEIAREIGVSNLAALEKIWISQNKPLSSFPEKRTRKRAANINYNSDYRPKQIRADLSQTIPDLMLERLLENSDVPDETVNEDDIIDSFNEDAKDDTSQSNVFEAENINDALTSMDNNKIKDDIIYGSSLSNDEVEDINPNNLMSSSSMTSSDSSSSRNNKINEERLRELANALSSVDLENVKSDNLFSSDSTDQVDKRDVLDLNGLELQTTRNAHMRREVAGLSPALAQFVAKIVELQDEVTQLRVIAQLADLENDVLTDALNEATMAQAPGTVSNMEFESLQQAIWVEKELQKLKHGVKINNLSFVDQNGRLSSTDSVKSVASKKGEPWRRKRGKIQAISEDTKLQTLPKSLSLEQSWPVSKANMEELLGENYLRRRQLTDVTDFDAEEEGVASIFLPDADDCPAVREYSTNCELADLYALPVDYEARALCNLHEMCYACGHSLHLSQGFCDQMYRAAANSLCHEGSACVLEAEIFLRTMKLKTRYMPHSQSACRTTCAARFLGMF